VAEHLPVNPSLVKGRLKLRKFRMRRCQDGVTFLGWRLFPDRARLLRANVVRVRRRLRRLAEEYHAGRFRFEAWLGHAGFGDTWRLRRQLFREITLTGGEHGRNAGRLLEQ
jgi:hypothetical protein